MTSKVRLVKCPKCWNVLPESVDVPVYRCGGCGTILQAKYRKLDSQNTQAYDLHEADSVPEDKLNKTSEHKGSSSGDEELPSSSEHSLNLENMKEVEQDGDLQLVDESDMPSHCIFEQSQDTDLSNREQITECTQVESGDGNIDRRRESYDISEIDSCANGDELPIAESNSDVQIREDVGKEVNDGDLDQGNSNVDSIVNVNRSSSDVSAFEEQQQESQKNGVPPFERIMSGSTFASTEYVDPCSEFSSMIGETCPSPITRSYHHAYDASISSFGNPEDHSFYNENRLPAKHSRKEKMAIFPKERFDKYKPLTGDSVNGIDYRMKAERFDRDGYTDRYHGRFNRSHELPPKIPMYQSGPRKLGYDGEGSLQQVHKSFQHSSSYNLPESPDHLELDKMKLLRMVYELEKQLKKTCNLDAIDMRKHRGGGYYSPGPLPEEDGFVPQRHVGRNFRSSRIPFSAEGPGMSRFPYPRDRQQRSEPLPPPPYKSIHRNGTGRSFISPYSSWPSSPQQYMNPEFLTWQDEDQSYMFPKVKQLRERNDRNKKHIRPLARAAPFITCQKCSESLQLPEDFLLFKKRCHRVRCGSCSTVLKFSLVDRTSLVPYVAADYHNPPPSEAEDYDESMNMTSTSNASQSIRGFKGKTGSSEIEELSTSPLHQLMGYSTVSQVFRGFGPSANGANSSIQRTSHR